MNNIRYFAVLLLLGTAVYSQTPVTVNTQYGPVQGTSIVDDGFSIHLFKGIPFAKPPTGKRRFKAPETPDPWTEDKQTTEFSDGCVETPMGGAGFSAAPTSEDCLYLNVYAPAGNNLPVMVWIHGGGLILGSASQYPSEILAVAGNVVVVTINYRLGQLGFFTTGDDLAPGNVGLMDQVMAMQWVKSNIAAFGGDPDKITIFGESAGSWSVSMQIISPMATGLFQRAIGQSGSLNGVPLRSRQEFYQSAATYLSGLGCSGLNDSAAVLTCMQGKDAVEIEAMAVATNFLLLPVTYGGSFLPRDAGDMYNSLEKNPENPMDIIFGLNSDEGMLLLGSSDLYEPNRTTNDYFTEGLTTDDAFYVNYVEYVKQFVHGDAKISQEMVVFLEDYYLPKKSDGLDNIRGLMDMISAAMFLKPVMKTITDLNAAGHNVYLYYFDRVPEINELMPAELLAWLWPYGTVTPAFPVGANHALEIQYVFGFLSEEGGYSFGVSEADQKMGKSIMNAWTSFAATGVPEFLSDDGTAVSWPKFDEEQMQYLHFKSPMSVDSVEERLDAAAVSLVTKLLPSYAALAESKLQKVGGNQGNNDKDEVEKCDNGVSTIDQTSAETALFILCAVVVVLLLLSLLTVINFCSMKKQLKKLQKERADNTRKEEYVLS